MYKKDPRLRGDDNVGYRDDNGVGYLSASSASIAFASAIISGEAAILEIRLENEVRGACMLVTGKVFARSSTIETGKCSKMSEKFFLYVRRPFLGIKKRHP